MEKTVLIIEDDNFLQGLEATKLAKEGYKVASATNSIDAFKIIESGQKIDLVLLDLLLSGESGFTILERIKEKKYLENVPIIVFSNLSEEKDIKHVMDLGAKEFMIKSNFTLDELYKKIKSLIG